MTNGLYRVHKYSATAGINRPCTEKFAVVLRDTRRGTDDSHPSHVVTEFIFQVPQKTFQWCLCFRSWRLQNTPEAGSNTTSRAQSSDIRKFHQTPLTHHSQITLVVTLRPDIKRNHERSRACVTFSPRNPIPRIYAVKCWQHFSSSLRRDVEHFSGRLIGIIDMEVRSPRSSSNDATEKGDSNNAQKQAACLNCRRSKTRCLRNQGDLRCKKCSLTQAECVVPDYRVGRKKGIKK
jgi:hypothetical protein